MLLYHGSRQIVKEPRILEPNRPLDFGQGFYTTSSERQSVSFAYKVRERYLLEHGVVNVYEANFEKMKSDLRGLCFDSPDEAWLDFVSDNRKGIASVGYDFVFGPVANDDVFRTFAAYVAGILSKQECIERLKVKQLYNQLVFKTESSLRYLSFISSYVI